MQTWRLTFSDREGRRHVYLIAAVSGADAKRELYRRLGVRRLVGVNVQPIGRR